MATAASAHEDQQLPEHPHGADLMNNLDVVAGAFNAGGHLVGGPHLTISGRANEQSPTFGGANAETISEALTLGHERGRRRDPLGGGAARRAGS